MYVKNPVSSSMSSTQVQWVIDMLLFLFPPRIVKMSSPNLNIVTLLGSCLTYSSAYLFGIQDALVGNSMEALIQVGNICKFCFRHQVELR